MDADVSTNRLLEQGRALLEQGQDEQALQQLRAAYGQAPQHARIRSYYGLAVARAERSFKDAIDLCSSALKQEFFNPDLYYNAACVYLAFDFKADAVRCLRRGRMIDPSNKRIEALLADLGRRRGPILRFLPRDHRLNVWLGQARHRFQRQGAAA